MTRDTPLMVATRNAHKLGELERLLSFALEPLPANVSLPPETGTTYAENALIKARAAAAATGRAVIADDSGIESEALAGAPGVRSARFAGENASDADNLARLRGEVPAGSRLRYVCVLAWVDGEREQLFHGECRGTMAAEQRGQGGFGYDPVFAPDPFPGRTMAELSEGEKDAISHRGMAARAFRAWLAA